MQNGGENVCKYLNPISNTKYRNCFSFMFSVYFLLCFGVPAWRLRKCTVKQRVYRRYYTHDPVLLPLGTAIISHEEIVPLRATSMFPTERFDIFPHVRQ